MDLGGVGVVLCRVGERISKPAYPCMKASGWGVDTMKDRTGATAMISRLNREHGGLGKRYDSNAALGKRLPKLSQPLASVMIVT